MIPRPELHVHSDDCAKCLASRSSELTRRSFVASLMGMFTALIGAIIGWPLCRFVAYPVESGRKKSTWSVVGDAGEFDRAEGPVAKTISLTQRDGWREVVSVQSVYVNRAADGKLQVLSPVCPHLGCSVAWHADQNKFICPCHGGQFSADGKRLAGPPPRGLDSLQAEVKDGKLRVQFQYFRSNVSDRELLS